MARLLLRYVMRRRDSIEKLIRKNYQKTYFKPLTKLNKEMDVTRGSNNVLSRKSEDLKIGYNVVINLDAQNKKNLLILVKQLRLLL